MSPRPGAKSGGGVAAPIAARIIWEALGSATEPKLAALSAAPGGFEQIEQVSYPEDPPPRDSADATR
ncbi:MAG TPA: hypothetical protein VF593_08670 [Chthoniobacteraceae bacterium]|jgi:hypothetical protein